LNNEEEEEAGPYI